VPLRADDVSEAGRHVALTADAATRAAIAKAAKITGIEELVARFDIKRRGREGLRVTGQVTATVGQICVVSLEPMTGHVDEAIDLTFMPAADIPEPDESEDAPQIDRPEPLIDGGIDLGAIAAEFVLLGIDPYPRKPDATFAPPAAGDEKDNPFTALAALKDKLKD
jgi:uncharacterized metal-binding protein YceD (DUF177 family)